MIGSAPQDAGPSSCQRSERDSGRGGESPAETDRAHENASGGWRTAHGQGEDANARFAALENHENSRRAEWRSIRRLGPAVACRPRSMGPRFDFTMDKFAASQGSRPRVITALHPSPAA